MTTAIAACSLKMWQHLHKGQRHEEITHELANGHVKEAGPKGQLEPTRHCAQGVAHNRQPTEQASFGPPAAQPDACPALIAREFSRGFGTCKRRQTCTAALACRAPRLVRPQSHTPADSSANGVACGSRQDSGPEQFRIEL